MVAPHLQSSRYMLFQRFVFVLGLLAVASSATASTLEDEARQLTQRLRAQDPYAKVMVTRNWQSAQSEGHGAIRHSLIGQGESLTGYIWLRDFNNTGLCTAFRRQLLKFHGEGVRRLILDVRGNPGGQRTNAVCIAGALIGPGRILGLKGLPSQIQKLDDWIDGLFDYGDETFWFQNFTPAETNIPAVLIQDKDTASAAEILSGALKDYGRATIIGTRSFGKGRSQECVPLRNRAELTICHTIQQIYLPKGGSPEGVGVAPTALSSRMQKCVAQARAPRSKDVQMEYALSVLDCAAD